MITRIRLAIKGAYFYRSGSTNQELKGAALDHFLLNKVGKRWDAVPIRDLSVDELDEQAIAMVKQQSPASTRLPVGMDQETNELFLQNLRLSDGKYLKRAAVLLFHPAPDKFISGAYIKIGYFKTDDDLIFQNIIQGSLFQQVNTAMDLLIHKYLEGRISYTGVLRKETYTFPIMAIREALLNAVVHKEYASGIPIQISVYDDKIIFWNNGHLPEQLTTDRLKQKHPSIPYNPDIAYTFFVAGYIETWGRGTIKIINECKKAGLPEPEFVDGNSEFYVTLKRPLNANKVPISGLGNLEGEIFSGKNGLMLLEIVKAISKNPSITTPQLAKVIGKADRTIERYLKQLQEQEIIRRQGSNKTGIWEIIITSDPT